MTKRMHFLTVIQSSPQLLNHYEVVFWKSRLNMIHAKECLVLELLYCNHTQWLDSAYKLQSEPSVSMNNMTWKHSRTTTTDHYEAVASVHNMLQKEGLHYKSPYIYVVNTIEPSTTITTCTKQGPAYNSRCLASSLVKASPVNNRKVEFSWMLISCMLLRANIFTVQAECPITAQTQTAKLCNWQFQGE